MSDYGKTFDQLACKGLVTEARLRCIGPKAPQMDWHIKLNYLTGVILPAISKLGFTVYWTSNPDVTWETDVRTLLQAMDNLVGSFGG